MLRPSAKGLESIIIYDDDDGNKAIPIRMSSAGASPGIFGGGEGTSGCERFRPPFPRYWGSWMNSKTFWILISEPACKNEEHS